MPDHPHTGPSWHQLGGCIFRSRPAFAARGAGRRSGSARAGGAAGQLPQHCQSSGGREAHRRGGDPPGVRIPKRKRRIRRCMRGRGYPVYWAHARSDPRLRPEAYGARNRPRKRRSAAAGQRSAGHVGRSGCRRPARGLSSHAQEHGGRRRHRHAPLPHRVRSGAGVSVRWFEWASPASGTAACIWKNSWRTRAISKCRSSAMARAKSSRSASAIVPCSAETRRSSKKPLRHKLPPGRAQPHDRYAPFCSAKRCATGQPEPWSSCMTPKRMNSIFWRSTPGCRSSTASARK